MRVVLLLFVAGLLEIGGGYLVWVWLRGGRGPVLGAAGFLLLAVYGVVPTLQPPQHPFGRVYAAYGAVFITMSALWGWWIDGHRPDLRDVVGSTVCLAGTAILMWPRAAP